MTPPSTIFITGAASGIGKSTAIRFAREGWKVAATDVDEAGLESLRNELEGASSFIHTLDVTDVEAFRRTLGLFGEWSEGRLNVLFNNAGILYQGRFDALALQAHLRTIDINLRGVVIGTYLALPLLKQTPGSRIISMSSASAVFGTPDHSTYSATKFGVRALTEALSIELEDAGIRVIDLMPSFVSTPMVLEQEAPSDLVEQMGIDFTPEDIADWVWKAAHDERIHWMNGRLRFVEIIGTLFPSLSRRMMLRMLQGSAKGA